MEHGKHIVLSAVLLALGTGAGYYVGNKRAQCPQLITTSRQWPLASGLARLWSDHVFYTRLYIISAVAGLPDADAALKRLMKNQEDLGNAIIPFYGEKAGKHLTELLKDHIAIAGKLVGAAKENNDDAFKKFNGEWHKNADEIASFLSKANPNWPESEMKKMLYEHLKLTTQEAVHRLQKQWEQDTKNFDAIYDQGLHMADGFFQGIVAQFNRYLITVRDTSKGLPTGGPFVLVGG